MSIGVVRTHSGLISGVQGRDERITVFKGVPYAAPPVGELRWRPPQSPLKWDYVRKADRFSAACPQKDPLPGEFYYREYFQRPVEKSEDCLYLNIWTPAQSADEKLPVYIWIHGGGLYSGYGHSKPFDGENIARMGIVVVTINYRLNIFGMLAHPELSAESVQGVSGNYTVLDQIQAMKWISENIAGFGGDPEQVTVGGQSGGGRSVGIHLVSPLSKGLFIRAIAESGCAVGGGVDIRLEDAEKEGQELVSKIGVHSIEEMRKIPADKLLELFFQAAPQWPAVTPVIDGYVYDDDPARIIQAGRHNKVAVLSGSTTHEGVFNCDGLTVDGYKENAKRYGDMADKYLKCYPGDTLEEAIRSSNLYYSDRYFTCHRAMSCLYSKTSGHRAYQYLFSKVPPGYDSQTYGAFHTGELAYIFQNLDMIDRPWVEDDYNFSRTISQYWANFIKSGNPNGPGLPQWSPCVEKDDPVLLLGDNVKMVSIPDTGRRAFIDRRLSDWLEHSNGTEKLIL